MSKAASPDAASSAMPAGHGRAIGRVLRSADFVRILRTAPHARTSHFALHHLPARPSVVAKPPRLLRKTASAAELSTGTPAEADSLVDESPVNGLWLGTVVPKKNAKRAVTRTMIKRQIKSVASAAASSMPDGLWVVRLRAPFDRAVFKSAASAALSEAVRGELVSMFARADKASRG